MTTNTLTTDSATIPLLGLKAGFRRFSVAEYHRLAHLGILTEDDNLELLEGYLVHKMTRNPPHDSLLHQVSECLREQLPSGWILRGQSALTLADSEPEPDLAIVRQEPGRYRQRHPSASEVGLVVEVSDSTLEGDRADKGRIYARAGIPCYWIVNIPDSLIEEYTQPSGPTTSPTYHQRRDLRPGDTIDLVLAGQPVATLAVRDLLT